MRITPKALNYTAGKGRNTQVQLLSALLLGLTLAASSYSTNSNAGEIYTWIDKHGVTHFSQEPPENTQSKTLYSEDIEPARIGSVAPTAKKVVSDTPSKLAIQATAIKESDAAQAKIICDNARHSLNVLTSHSKLNKQNKQTGKSVAMTEEQRQAAIKEQEQRVSLFCSH